MNPYEAGGLLGMAASSIMRLVKDGVIKPHVRSSDWMAVQIHKSELDRYAASKAPPPALEGTMDMEGASEYMNKSIECVRHYVRKEKLIPYVNNPGIKGGTRFTKKELDRFIANRQSAGRPRKMFKLYENGRRIQDASYYQ